MDSIANDLDEIRRLRRTMRDLVALSTHILSEAESVEVAATGVLRVVCESLGWDVGFFWAVNEAGETLVCLKSWHRQSRNLPRRGFRWRAMFPMASAMELRRMA